MNYKETQYYESIVVERGFATFRETYVKQPSQQIRDCLNLETTDLKCSFGKSAIKTG